MVETDILFLLTLRKIETQTLGRGVSNLKFLQNIYKMAAIFQFFHNGQYQYSVSINTWKTRNLNFGGGVSVN